MADLSRTTDDKLEHTLQGTLAKFWLGYDPADAAPDLVPGYVQLTDENELLIDTIADPVIGNAGSLQRMPFPAVIPAFTRKTGALFFDIRGVRDNEVWGGSAISTRSFRGLPRVWLTLGVSDRQAACAAA